jgi:glycosyltransferase involved in cell wall biosynthesis
VKVTFLTSTFHSEPAGIHAKFHDTVQYLGLMDSPPFDYRLITCNHIGDEGHFHVYDSNGNGKPRQILDYVRYIRALADETDVFHLNQTDLRLAVPTIAAVDDTPLLAGPNLSTFHRPGLSSTVPTGSWKWLQLKLKFSFGYRNRLLYHGKSPFSRYFDGFLAFSDHHRNELAETGVDAGRIKTMPPGVRPDIFHPGDRDGRSDGPPEILFVGDASAHYWKGFDTLIAGLARLKERGVKFDFTVVGRPPSVAGYEQLRDAELLGQTDIVGSIEREELPEYYRRATVYVNPSRYETEGMTSVEARACGTPVIGSDIPALGNKNTLEFSVGDPTSLEETIVAFLDDREEYSGQARGTAGTFTIERTIEFLAEEYASLAR